HGAMENHDSTFRSNGNLGHGGAIYNYDLGAKLTIVNSTLDSNAANLSGGGIFNLYGTVSVIGSTITNNITHIATLAGARIYHRGENRLLDSLPETFVTLAAAVNPTQDILFVTDAAPFL